ncbi:MAG: alpha/beta hydrolase [Mariniblastus sp.]|nr:alpha/beta hydrolase [Mariniblastus sp.]
MNHSKKPVTKKNWRKIIMRILVVILVLYVLLIAVMLLFENQFVYPDPGMQGDWQPTDIEFEEVTFPSADGTSICAWFLPAPGSAENPETVLLCHGNGENVAMSTAHMGDKLRQLLGANVLVFDYRGYGKSGGSSHEAGILQDVEAAMKWLNKKTETTPDQVVVAGHSIGGGPACHVAAKLGAKALVLQRTFSSLTDAARANFWFIPVDLLMKNRYPSAEKIKQCDLPLFQSHGDRDYLVPISSGRKLFENSPTRNKQFYLNRGGGHWDRLPDEYWSQLKKFIESIDDEPQVEPGTEGEPLDNGELANTLEEQFKDRTPGHSPRDETEDNAKQ